MTAVKICGLSEPETLQAAIDAGTDFIGFVFYPSSSRFVNVETASALAELVPPAVKKVGLVVDATDQDLLQITQNVELDMLQLHGDETPQRIEDIAGLTALPIMKAIRVRDEVDLENVSEFETVADWLLFDNKCTSAPGGTGESFDWNVLTGRTFSKPWMLSGGLTAENIGDALSQLSPDAVDISSGVESAKGIKDPDKIKAFIEAVKTSAKQHKSILP